jgi:hypothetical protein
MKRKQFPVIRQPNRHLKTSNRCLKTVRRNILKILELLFLPIAQVGGFLIRLNLTKG